MKRILITCITLILSVVTSLAQNAIDYTKYDVLAQRGDVSIVNSGKYYRMVVGPLKKPKTAFLLGTSKESAASKIEKMVKVAENCQKGKEIDSFLFCGIYLSASATGKNNNVCTFLRADNRVKFSLTKEDLMAMKDTLQKE